MSRRRGTGGERRFAGAEMASRGWRAAALLLGDAAGLNCALWLALTVRYAEAAPASLFAASLVPFNILFGGWLVVFHVFGLYDLRRMRVLPALVRNILVAGAVNGIVGTTYFYLFYPYLGMTPKTNFALVVVFAHVFVVAWRRLLMGMMSSRVLRQRVAFLGEERRVRELSREVRRHPQLGFVPVRRGVSGVDLVVADMRWAERHWGEIRGFLGRMIRRGVPLTSMSGFYESLFGKIAPEHAGNPGWLVGSVLGRRPYLVMKRVIDATGAAAIIVVLSPLLALVALAILAIDGAPAVFRQKRVGFMGREFVLWKFRTMGPGAEKRGPFRGRGTGGAGRLGRFLRRFRIDELPQLLNVVRGEMSLVGPRPEWHREVEVMERLAPHYHLRHLVPPGITGWAQLNFRATWRPRDAVEKLHYDLYYVKNASLALDISILLRTARRIFIGDAWFPVRGRAQFRVPRDGGRLMTELPILLGRRKA